MPKVVLDTNVLVSAFITPRGIPAKIIHAWRAAQFDLVTSPPIVEELREVLARPKIQRRYRLAAEDIHDFLTLLAHAAIVVSGIRSVTAPIRDPDDLSILATAIESQSDYLVTGDTDLLHLRQVHSVHIITPSAFFKIMAR